MRRLVISTVGTSLLTNEFNEEKDPKKWLSDLTKTANWTQERIENSSDYSHVFSKIIVPLQRRIAEKLDDSNILEIREMSAELNGIYGLCNEELSKEDMHYLIATDTAQGQTTAEIVNNFLCKEGVPCGIFTPKGFSTENDESFSHGIDELLHWIDQEIIPGYKNSGWEICFNLVGGFKAIQGYMNTIGMFHADKIVYIFEGQYSKLIEIPRLPITVDTNQLKDHVSTLALLEVGALLPKEKTIDIPESMCKEKDGNMQISTWGKLIWNQCKKELLSPETQSLVFPRISYDDSFKQEYKKINDPNDRFLLNNTIAKVSKLFDESNGDTKAIGKQVEYFGYQGSKDKEGVDHFYIGKQFRVSCKVVKGVLRLRHYGTHKYVEGKETT